MITDHQLFCFMQALAANVRSSNGVLLTDWEAQFLGSFTASSRPTLWFTGDMVSGRRASTDRLWRRYGAELNHPHPLDAAGPVNRASDEASPDGCEFWIKDEGRQRRCNEPAEVVTRRDFRLCRMHADEVIKNMRREGKSVELNPIRKLTPTTPK